MSRKKKIWIGIGVVVLAAAVVGANFYFKKSPGATVAAEQVKARDLEAIVSASGKIQAKRFVNMSAVQMGRVTRLAVEEGDRVKEGQFLLQIDPNILRGSVQRGEAAVAGARSGLEQARVGVQTARANLTLAQDQAKRQRELWKDGLTTREVLDQAESLLKVRETELQARLSEVQSREHMIQQETASLSTSRYNLDQVTLSAPFDGIVTRRNIEEGENVVVGTMNNAGTQLLTIADMSVIEAEVEVDETEIPTVRIGQTAKVTIDALPGQNFTGKVTEIGNSPMQTTAQTQAGQQATNFKVTVQIDGQIAEARPGLHLLGRDHDRHAQAGAVGAHPGDGRAGTDLRQGRQDRQAAPRCDEEAGIHAGADGVGAPSWSRGRRGRKSRACSSSATGSPSSSR